jgi:hypothetical protein
MPATVFTQTADQLWEGYLSRLWEICFRHVGIAGGSIVEIGPGRRYKIGMALKKVGFNGTIYVVEPDQIALIEVFQRYCQLLPKASVIPVDATLQECQKYIPSGVTAVVANHLFDDLIMNEQINAKHLTEVFNRGEPTYNILKEAWPKLLADQEALGQLIAKVQWDFIKLVDDLDPKFVILSQYYSYYFNTMFKGKEVTPDTVSIELLNELRKLIGKPMSVPNLNIDTPPDLDRSEIIFQTQQKHFWMLNKR